MAGSIFLRASFSNSACMRIPAYVVREKRPTGAFSDPYNSWDVGPRSAAHSDPWRFSLQGLHLADPRRVYNPAGDAGLTKRASRHTSIAICRTTRCSSRARGTAPTQAHRLRLGAGSQEFGVRYISSSSSKSPQISCRENSTSASP